jgi:predicted glycosyltransferase
MDKKRILIFLAHPAHFHLFRTTIAHLKNNGNAPIVVIKSKDILEELLNNEGVDYINVLRREKTKKSKIGLLLEAIIGLLIRDFRLLKIVMKNKPRLLIGTDWSVAHVGFLTRIPSVIANEDDTFATPENKYFYPFAKHLLLPSCCDKGMWLNKRITYNSYHKLAYLHPDTFIPNQSVVARFNPDLQPYVLIRLVKLTASHDIGKSGLSSDLLDEIIFKLSKKFKVFITSEKPLSGKYEKYRISLNPIDIHHALFYANLFIGDSQSMAGEAGVLGTPFIRYNDFVGKIGSLNELENKYKLGFGFKTSESDALLSKLDEIISMSNSEDIWQARRARMLNDKINYSKFLIWFIDNYPNSVSVMKKNPDYQYNFK